MYAVCALLSSTPPIVQPLPNNRCGWMALCSCQHHEAKPGAHYHASHASRASCLPLPYNLPPRRTPCIKTNPGLFPVPTVPLLNPPVQRMMMKLGHKFTGHSSSNHSTLRRKQTSIFLFSTWIASLPFTSSSSSLCTSVLNTKERGRERESESRRIGWGRM